jgi:hypothetical protein
MPGQGQGPAHAQPATAGQPPDQARAETYLRLRAEAELRRVLALPRDDPPAERGMPVLLRTTGRLALPLGRRAADVVQPLADSEPSADDGLRRLQTVANGLAYAGAIDSGTAESVLTGLEAALVARSRIDAHRVFMRNLRARRREQQAHAPAGPYLAAPVGVTVRPTPDSGLAELRLFTLVIAPDRSVLTAAGRLSEHGESRYLDPWPIFGPDRPSAIDDRGNGYELHEDSGWSDGDGEWAGFLRISPAPKAGIGWLELTFNPGSPGIRVDLTGAGETERASGPVPADSPAERLIDAAAIDLLHHAVIGGSGSLVWHDLSGVADIVTALDAVDALAPARDAVGRLVTVAARLGVDIPSALTAAAEPRELPAAWISVLDSRHRRDGPRGAAVATAVLPELGGARFVLAGLRSDAAGADLNVLAWGWGGGSSHLPEYAADDPWSWSARDDRGRWHIATEDSGSYSHGHANLQLRLVPPLHPDATSLELTLAGPTGQATATVPLHWQEQA